MKNTYSSEEYGAVPKKEKLLWLAVFAARELSKQERSWGLLMEEWNRSFVMELY